MRPRIRLLWKAWRRTPAITGYWARARIYNYMRIVSVSLLATGATHAAPPPGADPTLAPFFHSLKQPQTGYSCCDISDCRPVQYRITDKGYEAYVTHEEYPGVQESHWIEIPADKILSPRENPTGEAVLCFLPSLGPLCFLPGSGT